MTGRDAYIELYNQEPPPNAHWGTDISWWQDGGWERWNDWAEFVCIRLSYGGSGDDGRQHQHVQAAHSASYAGILGAYHYHVPSAGHGNADNFIAHYREFPEGTFQYVMYDWEEGDSWENIQSICETIKAAIGQTPLLYLSKSIADNGGCLAVYAPWYASYQNGNYTVPSPTADWGDWEAPYIPNAYDGYNKPYIWQFGSASNVLGSLDLNMVTDLSILGGASTGEVDDVTEQDLARIQAFVNEAATNLSNVVVEQVKSLIRNENNDSTDGDIAVIRRHVDQTFQHFGFTVDKPGFDDFVPRVTEHIQDLSSKLDAAGPLTEQMELLKRQLREIVAAMIKIADAYAPETSNQPRDLAPIIRVLQDVINRLQQT